MIVNLVIQSFSSWAVELVDIYLAFNCLFSFEHVPHPVSNNHLLFFLQQEKRVGIGNHLQLLPVM